MKKLFLFHLEKKKLVLEGRGVIYEQNGVFIDCMSDGLK